MDLLQDSRYLNGKYTVLEVDQDCVRMSTFIEMKLNCQFENERAFYEVTQNEEDLLYYKKILRPKINEVNFCSCMDCACQGIHPSFQI